MSRRIRNSSTALISTMVVVLFFQLSTQWQMTQIQRFSIITAYLSIVFFALALMIGPWLTLRGKRNPISLNLRRDLGIWSAFFATIHTIAGLNVHFAGQFWKYFIFPDYKSYAIPLRYDWFGLTSYLGLIACFIFVALWMISNNYSLRRLGVKRWKQWQRSSYLLILLIPLHGIIFQGLESRLGGFTLLISFIIIMPLSLILLMKNSG